MNKQKGFTLVEILVVIGILGVLITAGISSYTSTLRSSRDSKRKADLEQVRLALELYKSENGSYPAAATGNTESSLKGLLTSPVPYMSVTSFPKDPKNPTTYYYFQRLTASTYALCTAVESVNLGDPTCSVGGASCGGQACNYGLTQP